MFYYGKKKLHLQNALPFNSNKPNVTLPRLQETGGGVRVVGQKTGIQTFGHAKTIRLIKKVKKAYPMFNEQLELDNIRNMKKR